MTGRIAQRLAVPLVGLGLLLLATQGAAARLKVEVEGLDGKLQANVLALLAIYQERDADLAVGRIQALHRLAPEQIAEALAPFGHYRVAVEGDLTPPTSDTRPWIARYTVQPGPPIRIGRVHYAVEGPGADDPTLPQTFPLVTGDVLRHADYEQAKADLRFALASGGYLNYELVRHQVLIDPAAYVAKVDFVVATGPRYRFGQVSFEQDLFHEAFLRRYVPFKSGDVYDPDQLLRLQRRLLGTEYFDRVEIEPRRDEGDATHQVPLDVIAHRNKANKYRIGLGYATDVGPRMSIEYRRRYLGRSGHKLSSEISIAQFRQEYALDYRIPVGDPMRDFISLKSTFESSETSSDESDLLRVQAAYSVVTPKGWRRTVGVDFRREDYRLNDRTKDLVVELIPNISLAKTVTDNPIYTMKGYRLRFTLLGSLENLISPTSYLSATGHLKWIRGFAERYRLIARSDLGLTWAERLDDLPASRRFFAGGDSSVRGWALDGLGPADPDGGETLGGRGLAVGSLELERRLKGAWSAALFTDFGNAFDPDYDQDWQQSVGVGVRWKSPIGQVRADIAFPITKDDDNADELPPARLHLVVGPDL